VHLDPLGSHGSSSYEGFSFIFQRRSPKTTVFVAARNPGVGQEPLEANWRGPLDPNRTELLDPNWAELLDPNRVGPLDPNQVELLGRTLPELLHPNW
jgi:hypothetical protein